MDTKFPIFIIIASILTMAFYGSSSNFISAAPEVTKYNCDSSQKLCSVWFADGSTMLCEYNDSTKKWDCRSITSPPKTGSDMPSEVKSQDLANGAVTSGEISPFALKLVTVKRYADFTVPANLGAGQGSAIGEVKCNKGETATGGGYWTSYPQVGTVTWMSHPKPAINGWEVGVYNPDNTPHRFTAYVVCAHLEPGP
jgi:hypothetical protein